MARYIDADKLLKQLNKKKSEIAKGRYTEGFNDAIMRVRSMVSSSATADVVPKSEYEMAIKEVCRLSQEVLLNCESTEFEVREARARLAREIFEEIEGCFMFGERIYSIDKPTFAELKKKYLEEKE